MGHSLTLLDAGLIQGRVLDVGRGTGENALFFASRGLHVTGLDASAVAIERAQAKARTRGLSVRFIQWQPRGVLRTFVGTSRYLGD